MEILSFLFDVLISLLGYALDNSYINGDMYLILLIIILCMTITIVLVIKVLSHNRKHNSAIQVIEIPRKSLKESYDTTKKLQLNITSKHMKLNFDWIKTNRK